MAQQAENICANVDLKRFHSSDNVFVRRNRYPATPDKGKTDARPCLIAAKQTPRPVQ
jgi:hypothetical protein